MKFRVYIERNILSNFLVISIIEILLYITKSKPLITRLKVFVTYTHSDITKSKPLITRSKVFVKYTHYIYLTIILRNRAEYRLILSRRGRRPSRLKSDDIPRD